MDKHHGQIIEYRVRKNGYSISDLARGINVNRRSIYNWFNQKYLKKDVILQIGQILRHDFSQEFPELFVSDDFKSIQRLDAQYRYSSPENNVDSEDEYYKDKYLDLLEKYNSLLVNCLR
jgi:lambda repressor-like predicted transcriptional regulator